MLDSVWEVRPFMFMQWLMPSVLCMSSRAWPFQTLCDQLCVDMLDSVWEVRPFMFMQSLMASFLCISSRAWPLEALCDQLCVEMLDSVWEVRPFMFMQSLMASFLCISSRAWPFKALCNQLCVDMLDSVWEVRPFMFMQSLMPSVLCMSNRAWPFEALCDQLCVKLLDSVWEVRSFFCSCHQASVHEEQGFFTLNTLWTVVCGHAGPCVPDARILLFLPPLLCIKKGAWLSKHCATSCFVCGCAGLEIAGDTAALTPTPMLIASRFPPLRGIRAKHSFKFSVGLQQHRKLYCRTECLSLHQLQGWPKPYICIYTM